MPIIRNILNNKHKAVCSSCYFINDNVNLTKQLNEGFKRSVYWNECKSKIETKTADDNNVIRFPLDASFQGVNRLFVLAFENTENGNKNVK